MRITAVALLTLAGAAFAGDPVVFVSEQTDDKILRLQDLNGDGDMHDPGEVILMMDDSPSPTLGIDNSQGMVALGPDDLLATDNFDPPNILRLTDLNGDHDAFDAGETTVFFSGGLPDGIVMMNPADLIPRRAGGYYLIDNNTLDDQTNPEAIYLLQDSNGDGDVDEPGEVTLISELGPIGQCCVYTTFSLAEDDDGMLYTVNISDPNQIESVDIIDPATGAVREWITSTRMLQLSGFVIFASYEVAYDPATDQILLPVSGGSSDAIIGLSDIDGSGFIDQPFEIELRWRETFAGVSTGAPRDIAIDDNGDLWFIDSLNDRLYHLADHNNDGAWFAPDETILVYDSATAAANGMEDLPLGLTIAVTLTDDDCQADLTGEGDVNTNDFFQFLAYYDAADPRADFSPGGGINTNDFFAYLAAYQAGC